MVKDSFMIDQDVVPVVQPPANTPVAEFRMCRIDLVNVQLYVQILIRGWNRLIVKRGSVEPQKHRLSGNRQFSTVHIHKHSPLRDGQLRDQIFFSATRFEW